MGPRIREDDKKRVIPAPSVIPPCESSFPPEDFCSIRGVLSAQAGIHLCIINSAWTSIHETVGTYCAP